MRVRKHYHGLSCVHILFSSLFPSFSLFRALAPFSFFSIAASPFLVSLSRTERRKGIITKKKVIITKLHKNYFCYSGDERVEENQGKKAEEKVQGR